MKCQNDCGIRTGPDPFFSPANDKDKKKQSGQLNLILMLAVHSKGMATPLQNSEDLPSVWCMAIIMSATGGLAHEATVFWLPSYWLSGVMNTLWSLVGFGVVLASLCSGQPFNAFEVHVHPLVLTIGLHHQWI